MAIPNFVANRTSNGEKAAKALFIRFLLFRELGDTRKGLALEEFEAAGGGKDKKTSNIVSTRFPHHISLD